MPDFPYTQVTGKLKSFFEKIQGTGQPDAATVKWLKLIGWTSSNDPSILPVLRFIGFVESDGKPTPKWSEYRDRARAKSVLGNAIRQGYSELFATYPDANARSDDELRNFFATSKPKAGDQVISKTTQTFKALCELAEFDGAGVSRSAGQPHVSVTTSPANKEAAHQRADGLGSGITVNINIQLALPDTADEALYDRFFAALKKHLLS